MGSFFEILHQIGHLLFLYITMSGQNFLPYPLAVQRGATPPVSLAGVGTAPAEAVPVTLPSDPALATVSVRAKRPGGQSSGVAIVTVGGCPHVL